MALTDKLSAVADAIRSKTGGTDPMTLDEMPTAIESIETGGGGDTTIEDGLITGTLTEYTNDRVESVGDYAFYGRKTGFAELNFPNVTKLGAYAFSQNWGLKTLSMPKATTLGANVCHGCRNLTSVHIPQISNIVASAFRGNWKLTFVDLPSATTLNDYAFGDGNGKAEFIIVLRSQTLCVLKATNVFSDVSHITAYIPAALITEYQNATNWSTLYAAGTCNFVAIEGSEYE